MMRFHLLTKSCGVNDMCLSPFIRLYKKTHYLGTGFCSQPAFCSKKPTHLGRLDLLFPSRFDCARLTCTCVPVQVCTRSAQRGSVVIIAFGHGCGMVRVHRCLSGGACSAVRGYRASPTGCGCSSWPMQ